MTSTPSTAYAVSPDSGTHWSAEGAWPAAPGVHRIPLPLPMDGLKAVNVYAIETGDGLTLIDGGWAIEAAREILQRSLRGIGYDVRDITSFLVTHVHRDHYTLARALGTQVGAPVSLGSLERPSLEQILSPRPGSDFFGPVLTQAGAAELAEQWRRADRDPEPHDPADWAFPDVWLDGDQTVSVGPRTIEAVHTPGHTPGHFVFAERAAGILFAGDHVLPTITPSIGFIAPLPPDPLGDFMASLTKVRGLPDLQVFPAHGPVAPSTHARIDELLAFHEHRLAQSLAALRSTGSSAYDVAKMLPWTRHDRRIDELDLQSQGLATLETRAHLQLLVARGQVVTRREDGVDLYAPAPGVGATA